MSEHPSSWIEVNLGELLQFNYGKSLPNRIRSGTGFPVYGSNGVVGYHDSALTDRETLIIGRKGSVGEVHFSTRPCYPIDTTYYVDQFHSMPARYWLYLLKNLRLNELNKATAIPGLNREDAYRTKINLAPLNEQKRIADKLDSLLARVDACRERLDRVPLILKRFRQAVFDAATSGQLIEDWQNVSENQAISFIQPESTAVHKPIAQHPDTRWHKTLIGDLLVEKPRNGYSPRPVEFETATRSLTLTATTSGRFNSKFFKYINEIITEDSHLWLQPGDILIQRANTLEYVGVSAIYHGPSSSYIYPDLMMKCRANSKVLTDFLYYLLSSSAVRDYFRANATGTSGNMPKINQQTVISAPVRIPSIDEQQEIVRRCKALFAYADRIEAHYQAACAQVDRLTPTLLTKAFRGELVPQDPNDEPASVLLERIRAERAAQPAKPKRTQASRKPTITKMTEESVKEAIRQLPKDNFSFDELRENIPGSYDLLKDILFALLSEAEPSLEQVFDREEQTMRFVRAGK